MSQTSRPFLAGRIALVTGASRGIGRAVAAALADQGATLCLTAAHGDHLQAAAAALRRNGSPPPWTRTADLADPEAIDRLVDALTDRHDRLDILINNARVTHAGPVEQSTAADWDHCLAVNARAPFLLCRRCLPLLRRSQAAAIVNVCSVVGVKGYAHQTVYSASKHALRGFSIALAEELHPEGITVHTVCPGGVATDMVTQVRPDIPADALIQPEEVAAWIVFLLGRAGQGVVDEIRIRRRASAPWF